MGAGVSESAVEPPQLQGVKWVLWREEGWDILKVGCHLSLRHHGGWKDCHPVLAFGQACARCALPAVDEARATKFVLVTH
jgi:hypothetical protein